LIAGLGKAGFKEPARYEYFEMREVGLRASGLPGWGRAGFKEPARYEYFEMQ
jgi:hypothetical protein